MSLSNRLGGRASRVGRLVGAVFSIALIAGCDGSPSSPQTGTVPQPLPPTADFTFSAAELHVAFTDASSDPDGSVVAWSWSFGDGASSTAQSPPHTYASAGSYDVTLTVTDDDGATDSRTQTVSVSAANQAPAADFTFSAAGLDVAFTDASSDPDGSVASWSWSFGDGASSTAQSPSHTYASAGSYDVTLTVTDDDGATDSRTQTVSVSVTILVKPGSTTTSTIGVGDEVSLPVIVDMSGAGGLGIASFDIRLTWDTGVVGYLSSSAGSFGLVTINDSNAGSGELRAVGFAAADATATFTAFHVALQGSASGTTTVTVEVLAAGDELGTSLLPQVSTRDHTVTVEN